MSQPAPSYRIYAPPDGPAKTPVVMAAWATGELLAIPGAIYANARDLPALNGTMLAERVKGSPKFGVVQPGTLWLLAAEVAA